MLDIKIDKLKSTKKQRLHKRSALFMADYKNNKEFFIKFEDRSLEKIPKTTDVKSSTTVKLKKPTKCEIASEVYKSKYSEIHKKGVALYSADKRVFAVFDIDDTIKVSNVLDKKALFINIFLNEYKLIDSIQKVFEQMCKTCALTVITIYY